MHDADIQALRAVDLNLLVALDLLIQEQNVTRAAECIGLTQPAMSHALRRLREVFGDPLLVGGRGGMRLTPRAEGLADGLRLVLQDVTRLLQSEPTFDPERSTRTFHLVTPDLFDGLVLPGLLARTAATAPGINLAAIRHGSQPLASALESGEVDVAVVPVSMDGELNFDGRFGRLPPDLRSRTLFRDTWRCFFRRGHPQLGRRKRLSLTRYVELRHLMVSPTGRGEGPADAVLAAHDKTRRVALRVASFTAALAVLPSTDLVLTAPASFGAFGDIMPGLSSLAAPLDLPEHAITIVWHERFGAEPGHRWLREELVAATRGFPRRVAEN